MEDSKNEVVYLFLDDIIPNRFQPREVFDEQALKELAVSIREHGVIQPIIVRKVDNKYEIIAGERRYKASTMAGLTKIPAIIKNLDDKESSKVALIENLQRRDLTPIEEARTFQKILELEENMTQEELAATMGKTQSSVSNKLRLLNLPDEVQDALLKEKISERHARSLLNIEDENEQVKMLDRVIENKMTVRELERAIKELNGEPVDEEKDDSSDSETEVETEADTAIENKEETEEDTEAETEAENKEETEVEVETEGTTEEKNVEDSLVDAVKESFNNTDSEEAPTEEEPKKVDVSEVNLDEIVKNVTEKVNDEIEVPKEMPTESGSVEFKLESEEAPTEAPKLDLSKLFNPFSDETAKAENNTVASSISTPTVSATSNNYYDAVDKVRDSIENIKKDGYKIDISESEGNENYIIKITIQK